MNCIKRKASGKVQWVNALFNMLTIGHGTQSTGRGLWRPETTRATSPPDRVVGWLEGGEATLPGLHNVD